MPQQQPENWENELAELLEEFNLVKIRDFVRLLLARERENMHREYESELSAREELGKQRERERIRVEVGKLKNEDRLNAPYGWNAALQHVDRILEEK